MIKKITAKNFAGYGRIIEYPAKPPSIRDKNLFRIILKEKKKIGWRIAYLVLRDRTIDMLERHPGSFESFEPVRGRSILYLAAGKTSLPERFYLDKPVILKKGIWHGVVTLTGESEIKITENADVRTAFRPLRTQAGSAARDAAKAGAAGLSARKSPAKFRAVIFDMDGVIVDSMPYHFLAWYEALRPLGVRASFFDVYSKEGEDWKKTLRGLLKREDIKVTKKMLGRLFARRKKAFKNNFKRFIFKGAKEILICLKARGCLLGLVTGTPRREVINILPADIYKLFDCVVAGDQVKKGKPHPEPYLKAAKEMEMDPSECVVIENAPLGVESAKKAGMFCIAVATGLTAEYLKNADVVVDNLARIKRFIPSIKECLRGARGA